MFIPIVILLLSITSVVLLVVLVTRKGCNCKQGFAAMGVGAGRAGGMRLGNPGCGVAAQTKCSMAARQGMCAQTPGCCPCNDYEGEGCVPTSCAADACMSGKCSS
jgi:hypothetical protein